MASYGSIFNFIRKDLGPLEERFCKRSLTEGAEVIDLEDIDNGSRNSYIKDICSRDFEEEEEDDDDYTNSDESDQDSDSGSEPDSEISDATTSCLDTSELQSFNDSVSSKTTNKSSISPPKKMFKKSYQDGTNSDCIKPSYNKNKNTILDNNNIKSSYTATDSCRDSDSDNDLLIESNDDGEVDKSIHNNFISGTYCCSSEDEYEEDILADTSW